MSEQLTLDFPRTETGVIHVCLPDFSLACGPSYLEKPAGDRVTFPRVAPHQADVRLVPVTRTVLCRCDVPTDAGPHYFKAHHQGERMNDKKGLKFYEASHRYKLDGEWVQGVTTILGGAIPKPGLPKWSAKSVAEYVATHREGIEHLYAMGEAPMVAALKDVPWQERDEAGNRGTEVHDLAERYLKGEQIEVPDVIAGHVESCAAFIEDWGIEPILIEQCVGSREHQYAGKLDLVADSTKAPRAIYDWKTAKSGIFGETAFQLVAYGMAEFYGEHGDERPMSDLGIEASFGVHIRSDGYDVYPLAYGPEIYAEFITLLEASRINKRCAGNWKKPGSGYVGVAYQEDEVA